MSTCAAPLQRAKTSGAPSEKREAKLRRSPKRCPRASASADRSLRIEGDDPFARELRDGLLHGFSDRGVGTDHDHDHVLERDAPLNRGVRFVERHGADSRYE